MRLQYINRHEVAGFCGNVELRYMPSGDAVLDLSVATTNSWKDKEGKWHDDTEWHSCIFYRKLAEEAAKELQKGSAVYLVGRAHTREWTAKDGSPRKRKEIIVDSFHVIAYTRSDKERAPDDAPPADGPESTPPANMAGFDQA
ncbi:MAG: single-stranded DNA-binding protein [Pseudomonadota bacterium]|nr:single-stranded DNA-binding protein [Pseudomonadota bacterium]